MDALTRRGITLKRWQRAALLKLRTWDAIQDRARAGDSVRTLATEYQVPRKWIRHVLAAENQVQ